MKKIKGPSRGRISIRPRAVHASLTRHYEQSLSGDLTVDVRRGASRTAPEAG